MDKEEKPAIVENKDGTDGKKEEKPPSKEANSGMRAKSNVRTRERIARRKKGLKPAEWVALIVAILGVIAAIIAILPGLLPLIVKPSPTPTFTSISTSSPNPPTTGTFTSTFTNTPKLVVLPSLTDTPSTVIAPTDTPEPSSTPSPRLFVKLVADKTSGKPSLAVKFDARSSYLLTPDGIQHPCQNGPCHYTWKVFSNSQQLGRSVTDGGGSFDHTFSEKGSYFVTVHICWSQERLYCADDGTSIEVTR